MRALDLRATRRGGLHERHCKPVTANQRHMESRARPAAYRRRKWIGASGVEVRRDVDVKWPARLGVSIKFHIHRMLEQGEAAIDLFDLDTAIEQLPQLRQVFVLDGKVCRGHRHSSGWRRSGICLTHLNDVRRSARGLVGRLVPTAAEADVLRARR